MKIKDSVGKYLSYSDGDYYDDANGVDYGYDDDREEEYEEEETAGGRRASAPKKGFFDSIREKTSKFTTRRKSEPEYEDEYDENYEDEDYEDDGGYYESSQPSRASSGNVVDINSKPRSGSSKVILVKPSLFTIDTAKEIAKNINKKRLVLLNLEMVNDADARRMIDFLSGVVFANNGKITNVAKNTFFILPHGYDFTGDMVDNFRNGFSGI